MNHTQYEDKVRKQQAEDTNRMNGRHQQEENDLRQSADNELNELKQLQVCLLFGFVFFLKATMGNLKSLLGPRKMVTHLEFFLLKQYGLEEMLQPPKLKYLLWNLSTVVKAESDQLIFKLNGSG